MLEKKWLVYEIRQNDMFNLIEQRLIPLSLQGCRSNSQTLLIRRSCCDCCSQHCWLRCQLKMRTSTSFVCLFCLFTYFEREREREITQHKQGRGKGRGRGRESQAGSTLSEEPDTDLDPTTMRSWPEPKPRVRRLTDWATQVPHKYWLLDTKQHKYRGGCLF